MEVHRISENTIRVTMDADELKERGITMLDLLGNKSQIQHFFYQILSEVDTDHTFAKGDPVTFQVMPSSSGLELLISKVPDSDEDVSDNPNDQLRDLLKGLGAGSDNDNYVELKPEDTWVIANEYGNGMTEKQFQKIKKNAKCLIRQDALGNLRQYFD